MRRRKYNGLLTGMAILESKLNIIIKNQQKLNDRINERTTMLLHEIKKDDKKDITGIGDLYGKTKT